MYWFAWTYGMLLWLLWLCAVIISSIAGNIYIGNIYLMCIFGISDNYDMIYR